MLQDQLRATGMHLVVLMRRRRWWIRCSSSFASGKEGTGDDGGARAGVRAACGSSAEDAAPPAETPAPTKDAIAKTTENGPVKATVTVWPGKPTLGDSIYLRLTVDAPAGISVDAPFRKPAIRRWAASRSSASRAPKPASRTAGSSRSRTYTFEAPSSGKQRVPPLRLEMLDARASAAAVSRRS